MSGEQDPLAPLVAALDARLPFPSLYDLGGAALISGDTSILLERDELPELITLVADDAETLRSDTGRDFLLEAAAAPNSPLMLEAVIEAFLGHPSALAELGDDLVDVWLDTSRRRADLIGGIALEGSARLVLADASSPWALLDRLKRMRREVPRLNDDFAGRAVRVAGAVAEHFTAPEVPALLETLLGVDDVAEDASFELGMLALRHALECDVAEQARPLLVTARAHFSDAHADEERPDAAAFGVAVDAVLAYCAGVPVPASTRGRLEAAILEIRLNLAGMPATWRTPRFDTLAAWHQLATALELAQAADRPGSWLHAGALINHLVSVYSAHRTLHLLCPAGEDPAGHASAPPTAKVPGLHAMVAPRVERAFLAHEGGLAILNEWLEELHAAPGTDDDPTEVLVREQARALREVLTAQDRGGPPKSDSPASAALAGLVGEDAAERIHARLAAEPELNACITAMLEARTAREPVDEVPVIAATYRHVQRQLAEQCPDGYYGQFAADIDVLLIHLLRFMDLRLSETQKFGGDARAYLRKLASGEDKPKEKELGKDLRDFLRGVGLRIELEVSNVGAGRVDVGWRPHDELITVELKRDWKDITWDGLADNYAGQAISYQVSGRPINFFMVLDLTDKPDGLAALPACVHVRTFPGPAGDPRPRTLIMLRVQGNKRDPSSL
ncbi:MULTISPECIES: hypothetical protein [unclassified Streptomyces]|uniref:hypothetical protein n=1 Tax=unclassified Streptomyces TaxID=2593676 RepID=UPI002DD9722F|nr:MULTISPECIES: hypothetical protein [unclassified Streptomyces]WSF81767.1 hypothetical protein OIE70_00230 [Streptomyces sp. NBC_01744]WSC34134.1 hypothetical protein OHA08_00220 [Streptomyces sp. NBC_01763]WSC41924.1 hypothetical protein OHA08_44760 [Streptomyces sp. NBC_01763]WSC50932.1 hypothetical protein OG808_00220 [Streptomyces sp. NBC_01761]WSC58589.1 hypothetical protein OG808_44095 [Streptomyces sp. NBC_01761]